MPEFVETTATLSRDGRLRKRLLALLFSAREMPGLYAQVLHDEINTVSGSDQFRSPQHARQLLKDLCNAGYVCCDDTREMEDQPEGIGWMLCRITDKGSRYEQRLEPPDPLVPDGRIIRSREGR